MPKTRSQSSNIKIPDDDIEEKKEHKIKIIKILKKIKDDESEDIETIDSNDSEEAEFDYENDFSSMLEDIKKTDKKTYTNYIKIRDELIDN